MSKTKQKIGQSERLTSFYSFSLFEMCAKETIGYDTGSLITDSFHTLELFLFSTGFEFSEYWGAQIEQWERIYLQISNVSVITTVFFILISLDRKKINCRGLSGEHYHCLKQARLNNHLQHKFIQCLAVFEY